MQRRSPSWLTALLIVPALLALGASAAAAAFFELSDSSWRTTWSQIEVLGGVSAVRCALTLEGSFHSRTIEKIRGLLVGYVTSASIGSCSAGSATVLTATLPWHLRYREFEGTLPTITGVSLDLVGASFQGREPTFGVTCLFRTTSEAPLTMRAITGEPDEEGIFPITGVRSVETTTIPSSCGVNLRAAGTGVPLAGGRPPKIRVKPAPGVLGIDPARPSIAREATALITLKNVALKGSEKIRLTEITSRDEARFSIGDTNRCRERLIPTFDPFRIVCRIEVTALVERSETNLIIRYMDMSMARSETLRVVSP